MMKSPHFPGWFVAAIGEGAARTASVSTGKWLGISFTTLSYTIGATMGIGLVNAVVTAVTARFLRTRLWISPAFLWWSLASGALGFIGTVTLFLAFAQGADLGIYAFLVLGFAMVPGTLIELWFFKTRLSSLGWLGILAAVAAGYATLGYPSFADFLSFPTWIFLALIGCFTVAIGNGVRRAAGALQGATMSRIERGLAWSFWGAIANVVLCAPLFLVVDFSLSELSIPFVLGIGLISLFVLALTFTAFAAFTHADVTIPHKEAVSVGTFLCLSAIVGAVLFAEPLTAPKFSGFVLYVVAYLLLANGRRA